MYRPEFRRNNAGVPILSHNDIDEMGEKIIEDFDGRLLEKPQMIDIDLLVQEYLHADQEFQYLSNNLIYLGMTVFNDTDKIPIYDPSTNRAEYFSVKAGTIIIDPRLLDPTQEHRYRFTLGHEAGHKYLHGPYFYKDPNQYTLAELFQDEFTPSIIQCRRDNICGSDHKNPKIWTDRDTMEWQANALSAALNMPRKSVKNLVQNLSTYSYNSDIEFMAKVIHEVVDVFNVSHQAAVYRLKELGFEKADNFTGIKRDDELLEFASINGYI